MEGVAEATQSREYWAGVAKPFPFAPRPALRADEAPILLMLLAPAAAGTYSASGRLLVASWAAVVLAVLAAVCWPVLAAAFALDSTVTIPGLDTETHVYSQTLVPIRTNASTICSTSPRIMASRMSDGDDRIAARISRCAKIHIDLVMAVARRAAQVPP